MALTLRKARIIVVLVPPLVTFVQDAARVDMGHDAIAVLQPLSKIVSILFCSYALVYSVVRDGVSRRLADFCVDVLFVCVSLASVIVV